MFRITGREPVTARGKLHLLSTPLAEEPSGHFQDVFAQCLLCETTPANELTACGTCPACQQVAASTHPDLITIARPENKNFIPIELFIGDR